MVLVEVIVVRLVCPIPDGRTDSNDTSVMLRNRVEWSLRNEYSTRSMC